MWEMVADLGLTKGDVITSQEIFRWFTKKYPKIKHGTVSAHILRMSTNSPTRVHYSARPKDDDLFFKIDGSHYRLFDESVDPSPIYVSAGETSTAPKSRGGRRSPQVEDQIEKLRLENQRLRQELQQTHWFLDEIHDAALKERIGRLGSPPLDTLIREAGVILEDRLRSLAPEKKDEYGVKLVDAIFEFGKGSVQVSDRFGEQDGIKQLYRGALQFIRNPPMHKLVTYEEETARILLRLIDALLVLLTEIKPLASHHDKSY
jgi:hypothetical protein